MKTKTKEFFPLSHLTKVQRTLVSLIPVFCVIVFTPFLPNIATIAPIALHYPAILLAAWLGGSRGGFLTTIISSINIFIFLKPTLLTEILVDPVFRVRVAVFYLSTLLLLAIVWKLENALEEAQEALKHRDEFLTSVSHELRTPLTAINLQLEVMKYQLREKDISLSSINSIERQLNRQHKLVNAMIDVAQIESGHIGLIKEECDLDLIIAKAVNSASESLYGSDVQLDIVPVVAHCDRNRIEQVIFNLVHNAIRFGEKNSVVVSLAINHTNALIKVKNAGTKIEDTHRLKIFEKMKRPVLPSQVQGLGTGLYLARHLVELHGGKIDLESNADNTVFSVELPVA